MRPCSSPMKPLISGSGKTAPQQATTRSKPPPSTLPSMIPISLTSQQKTAFWTTPMSSKPASWKNTSAVQPSTPKRRAQSVWRACSARPFRSEPSTSPRKLASRGTAPRQTASAAKLLFFFPQVSRGCGGWPPHGRICEANSTALKPS